MKLRTYSSLAAFIAHYETLCAAHAHPAHAGVANPDDAATLTAMESIVGQLSPTDRDALRDAASPTDAHLSGTATRHRARAELKLHRLLASRGLLAG
jgi:hypothetical protein